MFGYTYGTSAHLDAATSTAGGYSASYDAAGDMVCRAPTSSTTCSGTQTGAQLSYDNERRLTHWQNAPTSPTTTADYRYDGEGNRVAMQVTSGGTTTTTYYLGGMEEQTGATLTKYYSVPGLPTALNVGGTFSYLASDSLSSVSESLDSSGNVTAQQLFTPYGSVRYTNGTMPTSKGFTGQRGDAATGLDYYNARYYDPALGQFASADSVADGINRYGYVKGNPETYSDPTGKWRTCGSDCGNGGGSGGGDGGDGNRHKPTPRSYCDDHPHDRECTPSPWDDPKKGANGCAPNDVVCQGKHAQDDAQAGVAAAKNDIASWINGNWSAFEALLNTGLSGLLDWFRSNFTDVAKGLIENIIPDLLTIWEGSQSAAWY